MCPTRRWFGLILLPFVSFSADGAVAIVFFLESVYDHVTGKKVQTPSMLARGRAIDLSIQFTLWWMPFLVLLGWWTARPMHLLFGACSFPSRFFELFVRLPERSQSLNAQITSRLHYSLVRASSSTTSRRTRRQTGWKASS